MDSIDGVVDESTGEEASCSCNYPDGTSDTFQMNWRIRTYDESGRRMKRSSESTPFALCVCYLHESNQSLVYRALPKPEGQDLSIGDMEHIRDLIDVNVDQMLAEKICDCYVDKDEQNPLSCICPIDWNWTPEIVREAQNRNPGKLFLFL